MARISSVQCLLDSFACVNVMLKLINSHISLLLFALNMGQELRYLANRLLEVLKGPFGCIQSAL